MSAVHIEHREDDLQEDAAQLTRQAAIDELATLRDRLFPDVAPPIQCPSRAPLQTK
jgi:hypothetical protein